VGAHLEIDKNLDEMRHSGSVSPLTEHQERRLQENTHQTDTSLLEIKYGEKGSNTKKTYNSTNRALLQRLLPAMAAQKIINLSIQNGNKASESISAPRNYLLERYLLTCNDQVLDHATAVAVVNKCKEELRGLVMDRTLALQRKLLDAKEISSKRKISHKIESRRLSVIDIRPADLKQLQEHSLKVQVLEARLIQNEMEAMRKFANFEKAISMDFRLKALK
ncbi:hypothetical protein IE077_002653, partial [Cardiosporidium cionae]